MSVFLGAILLADIPIRFKVDSTHSEAADEQPTEPASAKPYRKIFASYSHKDLAIVEQFERYAETLGDRYLRDWKELRSGENWDERLLQMIEEADVFQLFWSNNSMRSPFVQREWEHAMSLTNKGPYFVRPTYWETPLPEIPENNLPPSDLQRRHFTCLALSQLVPSKSEEINEVVLVEESPAPVEAENEEDLLAESELATDDLAAAGDAAHETIEAAVDEVPSSAAFDNEIAPDDDELVAQDDDELVAQDDDELVAQDDDELVALDDEDAYGDGEIFADEAVFDDFDSDASGGFEADCATAMPSASPVSYGAATPGRTPLLFNVLAIACMAAVGVLLIAGGWMLFSGIDQEEVQRHIGQINQRIEQGDFEDATSYYDQLKVDAPEIAALPELVSARNRIDSSIKEQGVAFEEHVTGLREREPLEIEDADIAKARELALSPEQESIVEAIQEKVAAYQQADQDIVGKLLEALNDGAAFNEVMRDFVRRYPDSTRGRDFKQVLLADPMTITAVAQWRELTSRLINTDLRHLSPSQAHEMLKAAQSDSQAFDSFTSDPMIRGRLAALARIAQRVDENSDSITKSLNALFAQPLTTIQFVFTTKTGQRYFLPLMPTRKDASYQLRYAVDPQLELRDTVVPISDLNGQESGKQAYQLVADRCQALLDELSDSQWEAKFFGMVQTILSNQQIDPTLKAIWLQQVLDVGCRGSQPLATAFGTYLKQLSTANISADFNWLDPEGPAVVATRQRCQQMLQGFPDLKATGTMVASSLKQLTATPDAADPGFHPVGVLDRDEGQAWTCALKPSTTDGDLSIIVKPRDEGTYEIVKMGRVTDGQAELSQDAAGHYLQGRVVFVGTADQVGN